MQQKGFSKIVLIIVIGLVALLIALLAWWLLGSKNTTTNKSVTWSFNGSQWQPSSTPPSCPEPLEFPSPVDIAKATAVLYPGQTRGGDYKPHGGFVFQGVPNNSVTVTAPLDGVVTKASRYIEADEVQYLFMFTHPCGIMYRFDHLLTLSPALQAIADTLPPAEENNSVTTDITSSPAVKAGEVMATGVGFPKMNNTSVDFGVYDLRQKNAVSQTTEWQQAHPDETEFGAYAICWLDYLLPADKTIALSLPGGDAQAGKQSDYCK